MSIQIEFDDCQTHLLARVIGRWTRRNGEQVIDAIRDETQQRGQNLVLLDLRGLSPPDTEMTRYHSGVYAAQQLRPPLRISALAKPAIVNQFAENVAVNRGANVRVFTNEEAALHWLLSGSDSPDAGDD